MIYTGAPKFVIGGVGGTEITLSKPKIIKGEFEVEGKVYTTLTGGLVRNHEGFRKRWRVDWEYLSETDYQSILTVISNIASGNPVIFYPHADEAAGWEVEFEGDIAEEWAYGAAVGYQGDFKFVSRNWVNMFTGAGVYPLMIGA